VLGAALALTPVQALATNNDLDVDSVNDKIDNCIPESGADIDLLAAQNPRVRGVQPDFDGDGFGTRCDSDYDNNDVVGFSDLGLFTQVAGAVDTDLHTGETSENFLELAWGEETTVNGILVTPELMDHNADGRVDVLDFNILVDSFGHRPGPSSVANAQ
jgi:hypothetical protein